VIKQLSRMMPFVVTMMPFVITPASPAYRA